MKITNETVFTSSIVIGISYLLYSFMDLHRKVIKLDNSINLIMSTHLLYMENRDKQTEDIKSINETLESLALTLPSEVEELYNEFKNNPFYDDE